MGGIAFVCESYSPALLDGRGGRGFDGIASNRRTSENKIAGEKLRTGYGAVKCDGGLEGTCRFSLDLGGQAQPQGAHSLLSLDFIS
jgi:hypothetical protein